MDERYFCQLPSDQVETSIPQFSQIKDRVALLKDFSTASTKRLLTQCLLHKHKSKA